jgi:hypothetical protein
MILPLWALGIHAGKHGVLVFLAVPSFPEISMKVAVEYTLFVLL